MDIRDSMDSNRLGLCMCDVCRYEHDCLELEAAQIGEILGGGITASVYTTDY